MVSQKIKSAFFATAAAGALVMGMTGVANATPSFTISPLAIPGTTFGSPQVETDIHGVSDALIQQTGPSTQVETGWVQVTGYTNNGVVSNFLQTGLLQENNTGTGLAGTYGMYINFTATVQGITGFGAGQSGTIAPGAFNYVLKADVGENDIFNPGTTGGTLPSVTDTGGNDLVLGLGTSVVGSAGFQAASGAPIFSALSSFILCTGSGTGTTNGVAIVGGAAAACNFNAATYFTAPNPFYSFDFASTTAGSADDLTVAAPYATLNGIGVVVNFVPEPGSLLLLGTGLLGLAGFRRKRIRS
jgi:hypothetical protein